MIVLTLLGSAVIGSGLVLTLAVLSYYKAEHAARQQARQPARSAPAPRRRTR